MQMKPVSSASGRLRSFFTAHQTTPKYLNEQPCSVG